MSMTLNMVGGGGLSNTSAILAVTVPNGSSVTITKGTVTLYPVIWDKNSENTKDIAIFVISSSLLDSTAWTITATLSTSTATTTMVIDAAKEYEIELSYHVPPEYQEVQYLQSTGTQYIDINLVIAANTNIQLIGQLTASLNDNIFLEVTSTVSNRCVLEGRGTTMIRTIWGNNSYREAANSISGLNVDADINLYPNLVVNGRNYGSASVTGQSRTAFLFAGNDIGSLNRRSYVRIKYLKITNSSNVVQREYYPCYRKSDSVAGLYDRKNNVFYTNKGSGTFVVGANV